MKKFVCAFVAAAFLLSAISCGEQADTEKRPSLEETVDFVLEVEGGRDVRILQLTDIQIIDSDQQRYEGRLHPWSIEPWKPEHM